MVSAALVLFMTVGLAFFYGGLEPHAGHGLIGNLHYAGLANMSGLWPGTHIPKLDFMGFQMMIIYPVIAHWVFDPAGWIYRLGGRDFAGVGAKKIRRFDDAFGVRTTHGVGGVTGMVMVGIFAQYRINPAGLTAASGSRINGLVSGDGSLLWHQVLAVLPVTGLTAALTCGLGIVIRATVGLRATSEQEDLGLGSVFQDTGSAAPLSTALIPLHRK
jgi:ammonia channel protein AmtB